MINRLETLLDNTGIPAGLDLVANYAGEAERYIDFVTSVTPMAFATDVWNLKPKLGAARYVAEQNLGDRHIYNSLAPWSSDIEMELAALRELGLKNVLLIAYNPEDPSVAGKLRVLREKLIPRARQAGFKNLLVNTSLMSIPSAAFAFIAGRKMKEEFSLPVGCAPSNGSDMVKEKPRGSSRNAASSPWTSQFTPSQPCCGRITSYSVRWRALPGFSRGLPL